MDTVVQPSCWDVCCLPARDQYDFGADGLATEEATLGNDAIYLLLKYNSTGIVTLILMVLGLVILICVASVVPGFARFDGAAGEISAVSHIGWWVPIEVISLVVGALSIYFSLQYNSEGRLEKGVDGVRRFLVLYIVVLALAMAANMAHLVLASIERSNCTSTLCTNHVGFLMALIFMLVLLVLLDGWAIYRVVTYSRHLKYALGIGDVDMFAISTASDEIAGRRRGITPQKPAAITMDDPTTREAPSYGREAPSMGRQLGAFGAERIERAERHIEEDKEDDGSLSQTVRMQLHRPPVRRARAPIRPVKSRRDWNGFKKK